ncbi:Leucine aminopeptidase 1, partial [Orchesella cincta]
SIAIPTTLKFQSVVSRLVGNINRPRVEEFVRDFSSYRTRYYTSDTGVQSQKWLLQQVQDSLSGYAGVSSVEEFEHTFPQNSVIARLEGADPSLKSQVVILGAHQDSTNLRGSTQPAPGADDNASGSVVVLETLRVLVASGVIPRRTVEFHWYAAEEVGLIGSGLIASEYSRAGVDVVGMVNFDVPGYQAAGINDIGIYTDNVDAELTQFIRIIVDGYCDYGRRDTRCGYGCSDHASFTRNGFPSAFPAEVQFHPQMHSEQDDFERVGFTQVIEFVKLAVGFVVEFAEPSNFLVKIN